MSTQYATTPSRAAGQPRGVGVGIDTSRYGHYAAFLRDDLQPAAAELPFAESAKGYASFRERLAQIAERQGDVHFIIRLDAAGQYAGAAKGVGSLFGQLSSQKTPDPFFSPKKEPVPESHREPCRRTRGLSRAPR